MNIGKNNITIVALSTQNTISQTAYNACVNAKRLFFQTEHSACIKPVVNSGQAINFSSMDDLYENAEDFDALISAVASRLLSEAAKCDIVYAVPGGNINASLIEKLNANGAKVNIIPGAGFSDAALLGHGILASPLLKCCAYDMTYNISPDTPLCVEEIGTSLLAGSVKLGLMEYYPGSHIVSLFNLGDDGCFTRLDIELFELDRQSKYFAETLLYVPVLDMYSLERFGVNELIKIVHRLRAPGGCPWDREQTHESIKKALIEECYEVLDAIENKDDAAIAEELGDVMLQCVFHAEIAREQHRFNFRDVTTAVSEKLIYRHPHVFGDVQVDGSKEVLSNWERLKKTEKHFNTQSEVLAAVPKNLPALIRAHKVQKKAADVGFDWNNPNDAILKVYEELDEVKAALLGDGNIDEELGDLLFAVVNVVRLCGKDAEEMLTLASEKFIRRFTQMEELALENGQTLARLELEEQNKLWNNTKKPKMGKNKH